MMKSFIRYVVLTISLILALFVVANAATPTASDYCIDNGGKVIMKADEQGNKINICLFPNGSECEVEAFKNEDCSPSPDEAPMSNTEEAPFEDTPVVEEVPVED